MYSKVVQIPHVTLIALCYMNVHMGCHKYMGINIAIELTL